MNMDRQLTRIVFICSFLIVFDRPKNFFFIHSTMYQIDLGAGMILNGGGAVPFKYKNKINHIRIV